MPIRLILAVLVLFTLGACSQGLSDREKQEIADAAVTEAEERFIELVKDFKADGETMTKELEEAFARNTKELEALFLETTKSGAEKFGQLVDHRNEQTLEYADGRIDETQTVVLDLAARHQASTRSLCESDYWLQTAWGVIDNLVLYLETGNESALTTARGFYNGLVIEANYGDISRVCMVDGEGRWALIGQPEKIAPERRSK